MKVNQEVINKCWIKLKQTHTQYIEILQNDNHQVENYLKKRVLSLLPEIQYALSRIKNENFGVCELSGEPIEEKRLLAIPWTRVSLKALKEAS